MEMHSGIDRPGLAGCPIVHEQPSHFRVLDLSWTTLGFSALVLMFAVFVTGINPSGAKAEVDPRFSFDFGTQGSGNGQFVEPSGIAIESSGNLWIADTVNSRIQKFNSKGEYLSQFGTYGAGEGQLKWPLGLAIDSSGNLLVADSGNSRILKFNSKGEYLDSIAVGGKGDGQVSAPSDIEIDSSGDLWIADTYNSRVQKLNSKGEFLAKVGSEGEGNGQFYSSPMGIAIDSTDNLWATDYGNDRVQRFNSKGEYLSQFGSPGSEDSQFSGPWGIAVDSADNVWVTDAGNSRVQKWIPNRPTTTTKAATEVTSNSAALNATVNPNGLTTAYHFEIGTTSEYGFSVPAEDKGIGSGKSGVEVSEKLAGLKGATTYHFRVVATNAEGTSYGKDETFTTK